MTLQYMGGEISGERQSGSFQLHDALVGRCILEFGGVGVGLFGGGRQRRQ